MRPLLVFLMLLVSPVAFATSFGREYAPPRFAIGAELLPSIATDGVSAVLVWMDLHDVVMWSTKLGDPSGGPTEVVAPRAELTRASAQPRVVFDGVDYLILWTDGGVLFGRFLTRGNGFRTEPFPLAANAEGVAAAWLGSEYLIAWSGTDAGALMLSTAGTIDPLPDVFGSDRVTGALSLAKTNAGAIIAYGTERPSTTDPTQTFTSIATVSLHGRSVAARNVIATKTTSIGNAGLIYLRNPRIASSGTDALLGYTQQNGPGRGSVAYTVMLSADGAKTSEPLLAGYSFGSATFPPATATPFWAGNAYDVISIQYPSLVDSRGREIAFRPSGGSDVAVYGSKVFVAYERDTPSSIPDSVRPLVFFRVEDTLAPVPPRRRAAWQ